MGQQTWHIDNLILSLCRLQDQQCNLHAKAFLGEFLTYATPQCFTVCRQDRRFFILQQGPVFTGKLMDSLYCPLLLSFFFSSFPFLYSLKLMLLATRNLSELRQPHRTPSQSLCKVCNKLSGPLSEQMKPTVINQAERTAIEETFFENTTVPVSADSRNISLWNFFTLCTVLTHTTPTLLSQKM